MDGIGILGRDGVEGGDQKTVSPHGAKDATRHGPDQYDKMSQAGPRHVGTASGRTFGARGAVLSHAWFGADENIPAAPNMHGLFVQYPNCDVRPAMAGACERWESVGAGETSNMLDILGRLAG